MSNVSLFSALFLVPSFPEVIEGKNDVALKSGSVSAIVFGDGGKPETRGAALVALIGDAAFNGGKFATMPEAPKGHAKSIKAALVAASVAFPLPACKGGKAPRALLGSEVSAFLSEFAKALGEKPEAKKTAPKLPKIEDFLEKFGKGKDVQEFASALLASCGGAISAVLEAEKIAEKAKAPRRTIKKVLEAEKIAEKAKAPRRTIKKVLEAEKIAA